MRSQGDTVRKEQDRVLLFEKNLSGQKREAIMGEQKRDAMTNGYGDAYYRISYIDLNKNEVRNLKIVDAEWEDEKLCCFAYDRLIENCAKKHVHESDREKFIRLMKTENLRSCFAVKQDTVEFTYRRLVGETYRWVQTEIVPLEDY